MKTLATIQDFLKTNPSKEEITKVMKVINNLNDRKIRHEIRELQTKFNKLESLEKKLKDVEIPVPDTISEGLTDLKVKIEDLSRGLPEVIRKIKKEK